MVHQMLMYDVTMSPPISASILKMGRIPAMTRPAQISPTMAQLARALYMLKCIASPQAAINHKICNTQTLLNTKGDSVFGPAPTQNCIKLQHLQARNQCEKLAPPINLPVVTDEKLECQESQLLGTAVILLSKPGTCQRLLCSAPCTERRREGPLDVHPTGHSQGCSLVGHLTNRCDRYGSPAHGTFVGNPKLMRCDFKICQTNIYNKSLFLGRFSLLKVKRDSSLQKVSNKSLPTFLACRYSILGA